jgi:penicillin G amidase
MFWMLALPVAFVGALLWIYRRPLPQVDGRISLPGLKQPVEVVRDRWGVPHLYAASVEDVLFAQGYVHAQDRLWQMELNRRVGHGRLSEAFGTIAFDTDRLLRILGFARAAREGWDATDGEARTALEAYARGVNAFIQANPNNWGLEFTLLRLKPEPWTPVDSLVWTKMMAWGLSTNWDTELINAALVGKLGPERAARLHAEYPAGNPTVIPGAPVGEMAAKILTQLKELQALPGLSGLFGMSNNWVVDGHKSTTGKPLLANDPHLGLQMPSIWYENHLTAPEVEVTGVSLPGVPGVVIGHNREVAWGFTAALPDTQDLYVEKRNPQNSLEFEHDGKWLPARVVKEEIRVKGEKQPRVVEVVITRHGPLIDQLPPLAGRDLSKAPNFEYGISLRWSGHDIGFTHRAAMRMDRAENADEFVAALADWAGPSMNVVWADRAGNIGYHLTGQIPIRKSGVGAAPVAGWNDDHEWTGFIPAAELPQAKNPEQHFFASANNRITGADYPHFLGAETMNGFRARRITELLKEKDKLSADDFARMHVDLYCAPARPFCELLLTLRDTVMAEPALASLQTDAMRAFDEISRWDFVLGADSVAGSIYELTQHFALRHLFRPHLGDLTEPFLGVGFHPVIAPITFGFMDRSFLLGQKILIDDDKEWIPSTRSAVLAAGLADALKWLRAQHSDDWSWGKVHSAGFHHPLGSKKPLDKLFNRGPYPYGGDTNTVWQAAFVPKLPISPAGGFTASWRMICDLSDWDASRAIHTTGQSGHPASPHYDDMIWMWLRGQYHPMLWSRARVDAHAAHKLTLTP